MLEGFQAGLAWISVPRKREAFRRGFDPRAVARFTEADILRLLADPGIIRSRAEIEAAIRGAQIFLDMTARGEDFTDGQALRSDGRTTMASAELAERVSNELKRRGFNFVGPTIAQAWLQAAGIVNDHATDCFRRDA